ncbi:MAG: DUF3997 domain-containing protein [Sphingobacteriales bacterium]|nr:MAG: DUF3997 domain-containing protein [Sphingobacteriales bacterium]
MKKLAIIGSVIFIFLLLIWALPITILNNDNLGKGYYYLSKDDAIDVGYPERGGIIYKSKRKYHYDSILVHKNVLSVDNNNEFIVALQDTGSGKKYDDHNNILYYIIDKENNLMYGPLSKKDYINKRILLKIPDGIDVYR